MGHDAVIPGRDAARPQPGLGGLNRLEGRHLEGEMVETRLPRLERLFALLPEREEEPAACAEKGEAAPGLRGDLDDFELEHVLVEGERPVEIGDGEADVAGGDIGRHGNSWERERGTGNGERVQPNRKRRPQLRQRPTGYLLSASKRHFDTDKSLVLSCQPSLCPLYSRLMTPASPFVFVGNHRLLDFVNTEVATDGALRDLLGDLADLVGWLEQAGALDRASARTALARWAGKREGVMIVGEARRSAGRSAGWPTRPPRAGRCPVRRCAG